VEQVEADMRSGNSFDREEKEEKRMKNLNGHWELIPITREEHE
jgi:hypothetical protein